MFGLFQTDGMSANHALVWSWLYKSVGLNCNVSLLHLLRFRFIRLAFSNGFLCMMKMLFFIGLKLWQRSLKSIIVTRGLQVSRPQFYNVLGRNFWTTRKKINIANDCWGEKSSNKRCLFSTSVEEKEFCVLLAADRKITQLCSLRWSCHRMLPDLSCCLGDEPCVLQLFVRWAISGKS